MVKAYVAIGSEQVTRTCWKSWRIRTGHGFTRRGWRSGKSRPGSGARC